MGRVGQSKVVQEVLPDLKRVMGWVKKIVSASHRDMERDAPDKLGKIPSNDQQFYPKQY